MRSDSDKDCISCFACVRMRSSRVEFFIGVEGGLSGYKYGGVLVASFREGVGYFGCHNLCVFKGSSSEVFKSLWFFPHVVALLVRECIGVIYFVLHIEWGVICWGGRNRVGKCLEGRETLRGRWSPWKGACLYGWSRMRVSGVMLSRSCLLCRHVHKW